MKIKIYIASLLFISTTSCGNHEKSKDREVTLNQHTDFESFISEFNSCKNNLCEKVERGWQKSSYKWNEDAPTVMVIDFPPFDLLIVGKYNQKTKAVLKPSASGEYIDSNLGPYKLSRGFSKLMDDIGSFDGYVSAPDLSLYADALSKMFTEETRPLSQDKELHGISTLGFIGEQAPKNPIVVAEFFDIDLELIRSKNFPSIREFSLNAGQSLARKAQEYGVKVINMSAGHDRDRFRKQLNTELPGVAYSFEEETEFLNALKPFYEELSNIPNVFFIQAGIPASSNVSIAESPIDCADISETPNRLRIGRMESIDDIGIPASGGSFKSFSDHLSGSYRKWSPCYDAYFNVGYKNYRERPEKAFRVTSTGVEWATFPVGGTSFAAPIATVFVLYKIQNAEWMSESPNEIRDKYIRIDEMPGLFDPLLHNQTVYSSNHKRSN